MKSCHEIAHHVEKLVSKFSRCKRMQELDNANKQHANRELHCTFDDDGSVIIKGRLPAEQGALIMKALELAMDRAGTSVGARIAANTSPNNVTAETPEPEPFHSCRADALAEIAETYLNSEPGDASTADRYQVVVHVTAETSRRIACDASILRIIEDEDGEPLSIGRKSRVIPPAMRRALRARDKGCRFPGCTNTSYLDGHHIEHWTNGGETSLQNLVQLCRRHHRLVHEGGFACEKDAHGEVIFINGRQQPLGTYVLPTPLPDDASLENWMVSRMQDFGIDADTCVPHWLAGDRMDWDLAVGSLFQCRPS
jgi:hypothetical protein